MNHYQRKLLKTYQHFQNRPMTVGGLIWINRRMYLVMILIFAATFAVWWFMDLTQAASILAIALGAVLLRDYGYFRRAASGWPVLREIIDWKVVEEKLSAEGISKQNP
jgi:Flp pilus assembly protein TadB